MEGVFGVVDEEKWVVLVIGRVLARPNQVRYQRVKALSSAFRVILISSEAAPADLAARCHDVHIVKTGWRTWLMVLKVAKGLARRRFHFYIHTQYASGALISGFLCRLLIGCPWVYDVWDHPSLGWAHRRGLPRWLLWARWRILLRPMLRLTTARIIGMHPGILGFLPAPPMRCNLILVRTGCVRRLCALEHGDGHGPDVNDVVRIVYISSLSGRRGLGLLQQWVASYQGPRVHLDIAGRCVDELASALIHNISYRGGANASIDVAYHGDVPALDAHQLVAKADVGLFIADQGVLNYEFAYPVKILEYFSYGVLVVATSTHGVRAFVRDGDNGFTCKSGTKEWVHTLHKAIHCCAQRGDHWRRMRQAAIGDAKINNWSQINEALIRDIEAALSWNRNESL